MLPYLLDERNNRTYEITANHKIKREYEKELQREIKNATLDILEPNEYRAFMGKGKVSEEEELELSLKIAKHLDIEALTTRLQKEAIVKMIVSKYDDVNKEEVEELISYLEETYGEEQVQERLGKIIEKVFTQVGIANEKVMPMWGMEE